MISYLTSTSAIIVSLKAPRKYQQFFPTLFVRTSDFQIVLNFEQIRAVTIFGEHGIITHEPGWLGQSEL